MVAGQPVSVQSPARNRREMAVCCLGRQRSTPGAGENVAAVSLMTVVSRVRRCELQGELGGLLAKQRSMISGVAFAVDRRTRL